jgi:hypothetical protein
LLSCCDCKGGNCWHVSAHPQIPVQLVRLEAAITPAWMGVNCRCRRFWSVFSTHYWHPSGAYHILWGLHGVYTEIWQWISSRHFYVPVDTKGGSENGVGEKCFPFKIKGAPPSHHLRENDNEEHWFEWPSLPYWVSDWEVQSCHAAELSMCWCFHVTGANQTQEEGVI